MVIGHDEVSAMGRDSVEAIGELEAIGAGLLGALAVRLDQHRPVTGVGAVTKQESRYRRCEDSDQDSVFGWRSRHSMSDVAACVVDVSGLPMSWMRMLFRRAALVCVLVTVVRVLRTAHAYELATSRATTANGRLMAITRNFRAVLSSMQFQATTSTGSEQAMRLSARNKISATVTGITRGEATANVTLDAGGTRLVASITVEAADELGVTEGTHVVAIVKASDVILAVED